MIRYVELYIFTISFDKLIFTNHREKVVVKANKTNLIIQGQGYLNTVIEWNDTANSTGGTSNSYSFAIYASKFTAYNISFKVCN